MRILIFHYHLNPGGVTRIIESQTYGLVKQFPEIDINIVTGACTNVEFFTNLNVKVHINPVFNYLFDKDFEVNEINIIEKEISSFLNGIILPGDILHVHNLNLGKNPVFTKLMFEYNEKGHLLINHAHDFAEDRPVNWDYMKKIFENHYNIPLQETIYPKKSNYKIGVLNRYDFERIQKLGIENDKSFLIPNPVMVPEKQNLTKSEARNILVNKLDLDGDKYIITYPVRVIRRKNIGELILLSVLFKEKCQLMVTLPPQNPIEIEYYDEWLKFCQANNLSIKFEVGKKAEFEEVLIGSDYCITTSIQEGFGMSYLEPWTFSTPVLGRNISSVTQDIKEEGIAFPLLYNELIVDGKDFKDYNYENQKLLIKKVIDSEVFANSILETNSYLKDFPPIVSDDIISKNKNLIKTNFSVENYATRLYKMYK